MLKCSGCGEVAGQLPEDVDLDRPWLRCRSCGGRLVEDFDVSEVEGVQT